MDDMKRCAPTLADRLMATLVYLLADQEGVEIKCDIVGPNGSVYHYDTRDGIPYKQGVVA